MSYENKMKVIEEFEQKVLKYDYESAIVIDTKGYVYELEGNARDVSITILDDDILKGSMVSHNHPIDDTSYSFSIFDIETFLDKEIDTLRGIDEMFNYEINRTKDTLKLDSYLKSIHKSYENQARLLPHFSPELDFSVDLDVYDYINKNLSDIYQFLYKRW